MIFLFFTKEEKGLHVHVWIIRINTIAPSV